MPFVVPSDGCSSRSKHNNETEEDAMPDFKAVIFDMDGVIVDSEPRHERAILEVVREIGEMLC